jgi:hypothetical protein
MTSVVPSVETGAIVALRLFDIAYSIDLAHAESVWARTTPASSRRTQLSPPAKAIAFDVPPVLLELGNTPLVLAGGPINARATARVYDFGVVALALRVDISQTGWTTFRDTFEAINEAVGGDNEAPVWQPLLARVRHALAPALDRPNTASTIQEDYLLAIVHRWSEPLTADAIQQRIDLVALLSGEQRALSAEARRDLLRQRFSWYEDDLVVLTWDRAFICEPRGDSDVADVIEVANAQLLELRYYDELLDDELPRMNDLVEATRRSMFSLLAARRFADLARSLYTLFADVTEVTEKVDNALQVIEDVYLARVYSAALDQFRVATVGAAVDRKLAIVRDTYTALYDEASGARGQLMELAIVLLIVFEIVLAIVGH